MRKLTTSLLAALVGLALWLPSGDAQATTFREMTEVERIDEADIILRGVVDEVWTERDENGKIWTRAQVRVSRVFKGDPDMEALIVDQLGGEWAGLRMEVGAATRYSQGEEVVLFLAQLRNGRVVTQSMGLGKWTIRIEPWGGREVVQQFMVPTSEPYDHRFIPAPSKDGRVFFSDFEQRIVARVNAAPVEVK